MTYLTGGFTRFYNQITPTENNRKGFLLQITEDLYETFKLTKSFFQCVYMIIYKYSMLRNTHPPSVLLPVVASVDINNYTLNYSGWTEQKQ